MGKVLRASTSVDANFSSILHKKSYFFYFTYQFLQNTHISLSSLHIYLKKYSFFYNFLLFPPSPPLSLTNSSLPTITPHPATIITTQSPSSSRKTNPVNPKPIHHPPNPEPTVDLIGVVWWSERSSFDDLIGVVSWSAWFDDQWQWMIGNRRGLMIYQWQWFNDRQQWRHDLIKWRKGEWLKPRDKEREEIIKIINAQFCAFMHNFAPTDVDVFLVKICKMKEFLYFRKLCIH